MYWAITVGVLGATWLLTLRTYLQHRERTQHLRIEEERIRTQRQALEVLDKRWYHVEGEDGAKAQLLTALSSLI